MKKRQQVERPRIVEAISEARSHGDLSENAEYHSAKEAQSLNEGRIAELEDKLSRAEVIDVSKLSGSTVMFGATVTLVDEDTEEEKIYQIVGESEADVKSGKVSITSRSSARRRATRWRSTRPAAARATRSCRWRSNLRLTRPSFRDQGPPEQDCPEQDCPEQDCPEQGCPEHGQT